MFLLVSFLLSLNCNHKKFDSLFAVEWFFPMSAKLRIIGRRLMLDSPRGFLASRSCWCRCLLNKASFTLILVSNGRSPFAVMFSVTKSATCSRLVASMSSITVPVNKRFLNSKRECNESVATCGYVDSK